MTVHLYCGIIIVEKYKMKILKSFLLLLIIMIVSVAFNSCEKETIYNHEEYSFPSEYKDYFPEYTPPRAAIEKYFGSEWELLARWHSGDKHNLGEWISAKDGLQIYRIAFDTPSENFESITLFYNGLTPKFLYNAEKGYWFTSLYTFYPINEEFLYIQWNIQDRVIIEKFKRVK